MITAIAAAVLALLQPEPETERTGRVEPFPGIVVDYDAKAVEVSGFVPIDAHQESTPDVMLELIAEAHGVRDFEALIRLNAEARQVHAALLLLGLEPGSPGYIEVVGADEPLKRVDPTGPELSVRFRYEKEGKTVIENPATWIKNSETGELFSERNPRFYFGGSSMRTFAGEEWYMARAEGTVVGLCTFGTELGGTETVGCTPVLSPHSDMGDPVWFAVNDRIPKFGTEMTLVLTAVEKKPESPVSDSDAE
ncbi:MAG: hypothetical protein KDA31_08520 [Phycisphaerales bacterium]|nr:hypothetical protein [Phycisphaerales bacterium]MCB9836800.1 hypothetical protein [Phycisphaera sp.]